jgi:hypothetical protein
MIAMLSYIAVLVKLALKAPLRYDSHMAQSQKPSADSDFSVLFVRGVSPPLKRKLRVAAAMAGHRGLPTYVIEVLEAHVADLERKGVLPKSKA